MCGIAGIVRPGPGCPMSEADLIEMRDSLIHRGPDDAGIYRADGVALASRRLAILDLSPAGRMPMATSDGRYAIVYNGEVYNFRTLRGLAEARGCTFGSRTDTEVLLNWYALEGPRFVERLNGMFAIAIWDSVERTLFLARDAVGIKPLFYHVTPGGTLAFGSEPKALFAAGVPRSLNPDCWEELLCFRYVAGAETPFDGIKRLLPGHSILWRNGRIETRCWWDLAERLQHARNQRPRNPRDWFAETFDDSVDLRTISDVPVGVLLSGGLDSSSIVASLGETGHTDISTFSVTFDAAGYDEGPLAREVARQRKTDHHELTISSDQILPRLEQACRLHDEPPAHANDLHLLAISEFAKPRVSVLLSGEGADETLGGYVRYQPLQWAKSLRLAGQVIPKLGDISRAPARFRKLARFWAEGGLDALLVFNQCNVLPSDLRRLGMPTTGRYAYRDQIFAKAKRAYPNDAVRQAMFVDQHTYLGSLLDRNDRMTMGASIECRVPFLDHRLIEGLAAMPTKALLRGLKGKVLLRQAVGTRLPATVRAHRKWGFGVPWTAYLRSVPELKDIVASLPSLSPIADGPLDRLALRGVVTAFLNGDDRHEALILTLTTLAVWHRACAAGRPQRRFDRERPLAVAL